jgi:hypothetical protein
VFHKEPPPTRTLHPRQRHTVILHAAVDCDGLFVHVTTGWPGAMSDSTILRRTSIPHLARNNCNPWATDPLSPRFILGDGGYGLRPWLLISFDYRTGDPVERAFNTCLDSGRVVVENAFGRVKARFRCSSSTPSTIAAPQHHRPAAPRLCFFFFNFFFFFFFFFFCRRLKYMSNKELRKTPRQIRAACILHNFVQLTSDDEAWNSPPLSARRSSDGDDSRRAPAALDDGGAAAVRRFRDMVPDPDDSQDNLQSGVEVRAGVAMECVAERRRRLAQAYDTDREVARVRRALAAAEEADR